MIAQNENEEQKSVLSADQKLRQQLQTEIQALKDSQTQELHLLNEEYKELEERYAAIKQENLDYKSKFQKRKDKITELHKVPMLLKAIEDAKDEEKYPGVMDFFLTQLLDHIAKSK